MNKTLIALILGACCFMNSAQAAVINLTSSFDCAKANAPVGTCAAGGTGTGTGTMTFDTVTKQLDWNVSHSGLSGTVNNAHFHGPALPNVSAGVQVGIGIANPAIGSAILTPAQEADMLAGLWYINIHSTTFPAGEIRGQVEVDLVPNLSLYDDFSGGTIDPTRWSGASFGLQLEQLMLVSGGALLAGNVIYGDGDSDAGRRSGQTRIRLDNTGAPGNLRFLGASVTMLAADSQDCLANTSTGRARASLRSMFFNDGSSAGPGDATGDVGALVQLVRDANGNQAIEWDVFRCTDAPCDNSTDLFGDFPINWTAGVPNFLLMLWDPANDRFIFVADNELAVSPYTVDTLADDDAPNADFPLHVVRANNSAENCTAGPPRSTTGFATFDDVITGVAVPTP